MSSNSALIIDIKDNVAMALKDLKKGQNIEVTRGDCVLELVLIDDIPVYHKFALRELNDGDKVFKYGEVMGEVMGGIKAGEYAHIHNIRSLRG
jgi:altronate dehydratase